MTFAATDKKILVIGAGSIGLRHYDLLKKRPGIVLKLCSAHNTSADFVNVNSAIKDFNPDYFLVCNKTVDHFATLQTIDSMVSSKTILVEKPLYHQATKTPATPKNNIYVAYNLRFHPILQKVKSLIAGKKILHAHIFCGSYLPSWRPDRDYRKSYSANKNEGGGVLRDLSHELDYCLWFFGAWKELFAYQEKVSKLEISSDDAVDILAKSTEGTVINIHLDYLSKIPIRKGLLQLEEESLAFDLVENTLFSAGNTLHFKLDRNDTYQLEHNDLLGEKSILTTFDEGLYIQELIASIERSSKDKALIKL